MTRTNKSHNRNGKGPTLKEILQALIQGAPCPDVIAKTAIARETNVSMSTLDGVLAGQVLNSNDANRKRLMAFATSVTGTQWLMGTPKGREIELALKEKAATKRKGKAPPTPVATQTLVTPRMPFTVPPVASPAKTTTTAATEAPKYLTREHLGGNQPTKITRVYIALDVSGSMSRLTPEVEENYNMLVRSLANQAEKHGQSITISLASFNDSVNLIYTDRPAHLAPMLATNALYASGGTALYAALSEGCVAIDRPVGRSEDVAHLVLVITDGEDTQGACGGQLLSDAVQQFLVKRNDYTIAVYSPNRESAIRVMQRWSKVTTLDQAESMVIDWTATKKGVEDLRSSVEKSMETYLEARASGLKRVRSFAHRVNIDASKLDFTSFDQAKWVKSFAVLINGRIDDTLEIRMREDAAQVAKRERRATPNGPFFQNGNGYYELKDNVTVEVQPQKRIILARDINGRMEYYTGANVRRALGLSETADSKLRAGDLRGVKVYVQSTAPNRQLLSGTQVLYYDPSRRA